MLYVLEGEPLSAPLFEVVFVRPDTYTTVIWSPAVVLVKVTGTPAVQFVLFAVFISTLVIGATLPPCAPVVPGTIGAPC